MSDCLLEKRDDGVALITLNRPDRLNSMGGELMPLLIDYLADCEDDPAVRCVALTGAGRAFCAGGDVGGMQRRNEGQNATPDPVAIFAGVEAGIRELRRAQAATVLRLHEMPKPTVAIVNGHAVGAGLGLALACDLRLCGPGAKLGTAFRNVGLSGDYGTSYLLQRLVGAGRARELYFTAEVLDAQRALELGIANRVFEGEGWLEEAIGFCAQLAAGPTSAFGRMKANLNLAETATLREVLHQEAANQRLGGLTHDSREAVRAFGEKRPPNFLGH